MRSGSKLTLLLSSALALLAACASQDDVVIVTQSEAPSFSAAASASCPQGVGYIAPETASLTATQVDWAVNDALAPNTFFAPLVPKTVYVLTSDDSRFGGLSGADFLDEDTLIVVADDGSLIWIDVDPETVEPTGSFGITTLKDASGNPLDGKLLADSEGVAWTGDTLFVSFERTHRVLAYDIANCGAMARGIPVLSFAPDGFGIDKSINENSGLEGLAERNGETLILGLETRAEGGAPVGLFGEPSQNGELGLRLDAPEITMLTGLDLVSSDVGPDRLYSVFRSYDPLRGTRISIGLAELSDDGEIISTDHFPVWNRDAQIDNYEAIIVRPISDSTDQIILISDDNFSDRQKTLLAVFEYVHTAD